MITAILTLALLTQTPDRPELNYFLVSQTDYMLLPTDPAPTAVVAPQAAPEPEAADEPEDEPEAEETAKEAAYEPQPDWYKVNQPDWYATEWVWGVKDPSGKIDWEPAAQPAAWARNGQKQPVWTQADAYGQAYVHYDKRVLTQFVAGQCKKWRAERQPRALQFLQPALGQSCASGSCPQ